MALGTLPRVPAKLLRLRSSFSTPWLLVIKRCVINIVINTMIVMTGIGWQAWLPAWGRCRLGFCITAIGVRSRTCWQFRFSTSVITWFLLTLQSTTSTTWNAFSHSSVRTLLDNAPAGEYREKMYENSYLF